jgi:hypothetical protein
MKQFRLLVDVREQAEIRGFHALAALALVAQDLQDVRIYRIGGDAPEERIACLSFSFDTGLKLIPVRKYFQRRPDAFLFVANDMPTDERSRFFRSAVSRHVAAMIFDSFNSASAIQAPFVDGNDTQAIAQSVLQIRAELASKQ